MLNIILLGSPGAGKGTQSVKIQEKYSLIYISTGDVLRNEMERNTELGKTVREIMNKGELVSDEIMISIIMSFIQENKHSSGFLFDGFPRTIEQAKALDIMLEEQNMKISITIALKVNAEELIKRLLLRGKTSGRKDDMDLNTIEHRMILYLSKTEPLMEFYKVQNKLGIIDGVGEVDEIFKNICEEINKVS